MGSDKDNDGRGPLNSEEFISTMAHDLRIPLAVVKESISLIIDGVPGSINEKQKNMLIIARNNVDKIVIKMEALLKKVREGGDSDGEKGVQE